MCDNYETVRIHLSRDDRIVIGATSALEAALRPAVAIAKPVNDVLGFRDEDRYIDWLEGEWGDLAPSKGDIPGLLAARDLLTAVAIAARDRRIDYAALAPYLTAVEHFGSALGHTIEVPSLPVLAAWALDRELQRGLDPFERCVSCDRLGFVRLTRRSDPGSQLAAALGGGDWRCARPAPGLTITCAQLAAHDRFARERGDWSREYRKVMARKLRGTVSEADFRAWKATSGPGERGRDWLPYDEWKPTTERGGNG